MGKIRKAGGGRRLGQAKGRGVPGDGWELLGSEKASGVELGQ